MSAAQHLDTMPSEGKNMAAQKKTQRKWPPGTAQARALGGDDRQAQGGAR